MRTVISLASFPVDGNSAAQLFPWRAIRSAESCVHSAQFVPALWNEIKAHNNVTSRSITVYPLRTTSTFKIPDPWPRKTTSVGADSSVERTAPAKLVKDSIF